MTDPVTNAEIEDVLSSIRRLVSEDTRSILRERKIEKVEPSNRLVLTPALRVADMPEHDQDASEPDAETGISDEIQDAKPLYLSDVSARSDEDPTPDSDAQESDPDAVEIVDAIPETAQLLVLDAPVALSEPIADPEPDSQPDPELDAVETVEADPEPDTPDVASMAPDAIEDTADAPEDTAPPWADPDATLFEASESRTDAEPAQDAHASDETDEADDATGAEHRWDDPEDLAAAWDEPAQDAPESTDTNETPATAAPEPEETAQIEPAEPDADDSFVFAHAVARAESLQPDPVADTAEHVDDAPEHDAETATDTAFETSDDLAEPQDQDAPDVEDAQDAAPAPEEEAHDAPEAASDDAETASEAEADPVLSLGEKIAALETAIGETQDQWEPDGAGGDAYAGTPVQTLEWEDHAVEDAPGFNAAGASAVPRPDDAPDDLDVLAADETILDEESLRELVSDIVREELQGALGERITRNVRKLVRREIHRALTAQELD